MAWEHNVTLRIIIPCALVHLALREIHLLGVLLKVNTISLYKSVYEANLKNTPQFLRQCQQLKSHLHAIRHRVGQILNANCIMVFLLVLVCHHLLEHHQTVDQNV